MITIINEKEGHGYAKCDCDLLFEFEVMIDLNIKNFFPICPRCKNNIFSTEELRANELIKKFEMFLWSVNKVTSCFRHGRKQSPIHLENLSNKQIEIEDLIKEYLNER